MFAGGAGLIFAEETALGPFFIAGMWIVGALCAAAIVLAIASRWRKSGGDDRLSASDQLAQYRTLFERGEISEEEYESLRRVLGGELRRSARASRVGNDGVAPPKPVKPAAPATEPPREEVGPPPPPPEAPPGPSDPGIRPA
jgi:hypothetical protein